MFPHPKKTKPSTFAFHPSFLSPLPSTHHTLFYLFNSDSAMALVSAAPFIALLDEPDYDLKAYALQSLDEHVDQLWAEIADHITQM